MGVRRRTRYIKLSLTAADNVLQQITCTIKRTKQEECFDEETKLKIQAYLDEIDKKQQQKIHTRQNISSLYLTGSTIFCSLQANFIRKNYQRQDFQTGEVVPGNTKRGILLNAMVLQQQHQQQYQRMILSSQTC